MKKEKRPVIFNEDNRFSLEGISRERACNTPFAGERITIVGSKTEWVAIHAHYRTALRRTSIYWKQDGTATCTFKGNRLYGNLSSGLKNAILFLYALDWIKDNRWTLEILKERKTLWVKVITGKITNPRNLCIEFSKQYFKGVYSYKSLKEFASRTQAFSLWDLYDYTTNPEAALEKLLEIQRNYREWEIRDADDDGGATFRDMIHTSRILGEQFDPLWSQKRLNEEHLRQIRTINLHKLEECNAKSIAPEFSEGGLSLILNEKDCCEEGMLMNNCIHTNYWRAIRVGQYLVARGTLNGEYVNLGISYYGKMLAFDQIAKKYNKKTDINTRNQAISWISRNRGTLIRILETISNREPEPERENELPLINF